MTSRRGAFTLIEMLVVVAVIILLLGILTPAIIGARIEAAKAQTKVQIHSLVLAAEAYRTVMGSSPGPASNGAMAGSGPTGAENLVLGLLGCYKSGSGSAASAWKNATDGSGPTLDNLDQINNMSELQASRRHDAFYTPSEKELNTESSPDYGGTPLWEFVDFRFSPERPLLYFRANLSANGQWNNSGSQSAYNAAQNSDYDPTISQNDLGKLVWNSELDANGSLGNGDRVYRPDSFIIISAGPDREFGTADDLTNF